MKALLLFLLSASPALAAHNVTVVVDGETLQCSSGGSSGGCSCRIDRSNGGGSITFAITYNGADIYTPGSTYWSSTDALAACKREIQSLDACK
jgi:hypothetical protein